MLQKSSHISGIMNAILESTIPVWLHEHRLQSTFFSLVIECIVFGQIYQKDKKYLNHLRPLSLNLLFIFQTTMASRTINRTRFIFPCIDYSYPYNTVDTLIDHFLFFFYS